MKLLGLYSALTLISISAQGQNFVDLVKVYFNTTPSNSFKNSTSSTLINEFGADIMVPKVINSNVALLGALNFEQTNVKIFPNEDPSGLSIVGARIGLNIKHSENWSGTYLLLPRLASDLFYSSSKNFQMGSVVLMRFNRTPELNYKAGLYVNSEKFGPMFTPLFGLYFKKDAGKFEANIILPQQVDMNYSLNSFMNLGVNFTGQIKSFYLSETKDNIPMYVVKTSNETCGYLRFNFTRSLMLQTRFGFSIGRSYKVFEEEDKINFAISFLKFGNDRTQLNPDIKNGLLFQTLLVYRFIQQ